MKGPTLRALMELTSKTLLQGLRFYSVIELTEKRSAEVMRVADYRSALSAMLTELTTWCKKYTRKVYDPR